MAASEHTREERLRHSDTHRTCTKCREYKLHAEFGQDPRGRYGLKSVCKQCFAIAHRERKGPPANGRRLSPRYLARLGIEVSPDVLETPDGRVVRILLQDGTFTTVDEADWHLVSAHLWHRAVNGYVVTNRQGRVGDLVYMHRLIMGAPENVPVDHIDRDRTNNRRRNLRLATVSQNNANSVSRAKSRSGLKGVRLLPSGRWAAHISIRGDLRHLGTYDTAEAAARAYDRAAREGYGEFAVLNFPT